MNAEDLFLKKYGNKITASESWVIRFSEDYCKLKVDGILSQKLLTTKRCAKRFIKKK
jgi:hypothetical protein